LGVAVAAPKNGLGAEVRRRKLRENGVARSRHVAPIRRSGRSITIRATGSRCRSNNLVFVATTGNRQQLDDRIDRQVEIAAMRPDSKGKLPIAPTLQTYRDFNPFSIDPLICFRTPVQDVSCAQTAVGI